VQILSISKGCIM